MTALHDPLKTITHMFDASGTLRYGEHVNLNPAVTPSPEGYLEA